MGWAAGESCRKDLQGMEGMRESRQNGKGNISVRGQHLNIKHLNLRSPYVKSMDAERPA